MSSDPKDSKQDKLDIATSVLPLAQGYSYHVFLSHNSKDKAAIKKLKNVLEAEGCRCWYDETELQPGLNWQNILESGIRNSQSVIVAIAESGEGPWQEEEMQAALQIAVEKKIPVIPVLLPGVPSKPELPMLLRNRTWVDLRKGYDNEAIQKLIWGITGTKDGGGSNEMRETASLPSRGCSIIISIAVSLSVAAAFLIPQISRELNVYETRSTLRQWDLEKDLAIKVATDLHDNESVAQSQFYINQRAKYSLSLTSDATKEFIGLSFSIPFNTEPTSIMIEINIDGNFDIEKFEAFDGKPVNVKGTVAKIEKVSPVRATIYLEHAELTDLPKNQ